MKFQLFVAVVALFKISSAYPSGGGNPIKPDKLLGTLPLLIVGTPPLEVDEPSNTIENLPGKGTDFHGKDKRNEAGDSCCPTVVEVIEPLGGKNRAGDLVELYQGDGVRQRFYEVSCSPQVADQHCKYLDRRHAPHSKCVQQYSYSYALVRDFGVDYDDTANGGWRLDYIKVRSGCSCQISPRGHHNTR